MRGAIDVGDGGKLEVRSTDAAWRYEWKQNGVA